MSVVFRINGLHFYLSSTSPPSTGQCPPLKQEASVDTWSEIDRRNARVLHPLYSKYTSTAPKRFASYYHQFDKDSNKSFYFDSYHSYHCQRRSSQPTDDQDFMTPTAYLNKYMNKPLTIPPINNDATLLFGNSIIKSNKADVLSTFERNALSGDNTHVYVDKNGVVITEDGPFWPETYRILHPTPKLLSRDLKQESFYLSSSVSNLINQQTYDNQPAIHKYTEPFKHPVTVYDMEKTAKIQHIKPTENEQMCPPLIFEARFESGNLRQAKRVGQFEYELILRTDLYTRRHTQWYYFRVQNMIANITYRLRIINLMKKSSLYNEGMQILLYSGVDARRESRGWQRIGHHINYSEYKQRSYNSLLDRDINYFELDFQLEFAHSGDTCYIAHCFPYTYSDLKDDLEYLSRTRPCDVFRQEVLCESQAGNSCFMVTVTDESVPINKKKFVFISARIHPGETNSSFMMRGVLEYITSNDKIAQKLRSQIVFKIIPMLNPDGVIVGNYRCSLTGKDKNRNFRHPRKQTFPIIYHMKELIRRLQNEQREILAFCDLHGHSRKLNVFAYGCDGCDGPEPNMKDFLEARVLPFIMSRTAPDMFAFDHCKFHIHRCKESTGRVVMWKEMLIKNSFTLEASFAGTGIVERPSHFNMKDYEKFGQAICHSLRQYLDVVSDSSRLDSIFMDITKSIVGTLDKENIPIELSVPSDSEEKQVVIPKPVIKSVSNCLEILAKCHKTIKARDDSSSSDSDSDPEGGEIPEISHPKIVNTPKKKQKKRRSEKTIEDRIEKLNRKRQAKENVDKSRPIRVPHTFASEIDINPQFKQILPIYQMEKATRPLPERGTLFTSKYANRNGYGLPIFTTERAFERKHQKMVNSGLLDPNGDRQTTDEHDTDPEQETYFTITRTSRCDQVVLLDSTLKIQRATSLASLPEKQLRKFSSENVIRSAVIPPAIAETTPIQKQSKRSNSHSKQIELTDPPFDATSARSSPKHETLPPRTKMPQINSNNNRYRRSFAQKPLNPIDSKYKYRSIDSNQENNNLVESIEPVNQRLKRQFNGSLEKPRRM
ncbi:unnamed protein product [Adineta ricciae]|uniref:Peptidase M14 domain-containing protein n=1 Tax=Adineta ricciae TaxID=249248 RepID=A0A815ES46_ADIRI|nr:unnamed protein product [Adineta ricciae]